jgi:hypothetical protein
LCWDLAKNLTTGFSGTSLAPELLPLFISQQNLPQLRNTDKKVDANILREENNKYVALESETKGIDILKRLVNEEITVLLDVGALILELENEEVARNWLEMIPEERGIEAAVYFDSADRMVVKDRLGRTTRLELSPFRTRLNHCVIYLDDAHTRGTDLKIPPVIEVIIHRNWFK